MADLGGSGSSGSETSFVAVGINSTRADLGGSGSSGSEPPPPGGHLNSAGSDLAKLVRQVAALKNNYEILILDEKAKKLVFESTDLGRLARENEDLQDTVAKLQERVTKLETELKERVTKLETEPTLNADGHVGARSG
jgi:hypothetical protein